MARKLVMDPVTGYKRYVDVPDTPSSSGNPFKRPRRPGTSSNPFEKTKGEQIAADMRAQTKANKPSVQATTAQSTNMPPLPEDIYRDIMQRLYGSQAKSGDLSQYTGNVMPTQTGTGTFSVKDDEFLTGLGQQLGLEPGQDILSTLVGERPESVRGAYEDVIKSLEEQTKGMTATEKELISGSQRRALAEQARKSGGRVSALRGGQRLEQAKTAQMGLALQEAAKVQEVEEASRGRAEAGRAGLAQLEMDIAKQDRDRQMEYDARKSNIAMQMYNLAEQTRIGKLIRDKLEE